ncbi:hypothetical protein BBJ28_00014393 [Nothophytophthora sp. Chile5]|nr:hypothetical protein BBJ28_00014393 [Nothophytophthora sp. Chile5]
MAPFFFNSSTVFFSWIHADSFLTQAPPITTMLARSVQRLPKAVRQISSSPPARVLQQTPSTSGGSAVPEKGIPPVSQGEQAWCEIYGVDYEKQLEEALKESPLLAPASGKKVNYPTADPNTIHEASGLVAPAKPQSKADIWNVVFGHTSA